MMATGIVSSPYREPRAGSPGDHQRRLRRTRPKLRGTKGKTLGKSLAELARGLGGPEDLAHHARPQQTAEEGREGVAQDVAKDRHRRAGRGQHIDPRRRVEVARGEHQRLDAGRVVQGEGGGDQRAPGVAENDRRRGVELDQRAVDQVGLRLRRPDRAAGPLAVAIARPVEDDHPVGLGRLRDEPARLEVLDHAAVAVQQDQRLALPALDVVQPHPVDLEELAFRGIAALRAPCLLPVDQGRDGEGRHRNRCCSRVRVVG